MTDPKSDNLAKTADKVTSKAATLVETAADIAERTFETAVDKADMMSAETADKLIKGARKTNSLAHKNSRKLGIGAMIAGTAAVLGGLVFLSSKATKKSPKSKS